MTHSNTCNRCRHVHERQEWISSVSLRVVYCTECKCKHALIDQLAYGSGHGKTS